MTSCTVHSSIGVAPFSEGTTMTVVVSVGTLLGKFSDNLDVVADLPSVRLEGVFLVEEEED